MTEETRTTYRLNQFIARCGVASRRSAEQLIAEGVVLVNNEVAQHPGEQVTPGRDQVKVRGKLISLPAACQILLHKPKGIICSRFDPEGRRTVFDLLPGHLRKSGIQTVGRLDFDSSGLLLLTNQGEMHRFLEHPSSGLRRVYHVKARGELTPQRQQRCLDGIRLKDGPARATGIWLHKFSGGISRFDIAVEEGRNREVRRICEHIGLDVLDLKRIRFGPFELHDLPPGAWREWFPSEIEKLRKARLQPKRRGGKSQPGASKGAKARAEKPKPKPKPRQTQS